MLSRVKFTPKSFMRLTSARCLVGGWKPQKKNLKEKVDERPKKVHLSASCRLVTEPTNLAQTF